MKTLIISCIVALLLLLPAVLIIGCQQQSVPAPQPAIETKTYNESEYGFSVEYPADWDAETGEEHYLRTTGMKKGPNGIPVVFSRSVSINLAPEPSPAQNASKSSQEIQDYCRIQVMVDEIPNAPELKNWKLQDFIKLRQEALETKVYRNSEIEKIEEYETTIDNLPAIVYTYRIKPYPRNPADYNIHKEADFIANDKYFYSILYRTWAEFYENDAVCFELIIHSFKFD